MNKQNAINLPKVSTVSTVSTVNNRIDNVYNKRLTDVELLTSITDCIINNEHDAAHNIFKYAMKNNINMRLDDEMFLWACDNGFQDIIVYILHCCDYIDKKNQYEKALQYLCSKGYDIAIRGILSLDQNINIRINDDILFRKACISGNLDLVKILLSYDNTIDIHCKLDQSFRYACIYNCVEIINYLLDNYLNKSQNNNYYYIDGCYYIAKNRDDTEYLNYYVKKISEDESYMYYDDETYKIFVHHYNDINIFCNDSKYIDKFLENIYQSKMQTNECIIN